MKRTKPGGPTEPLRRKAAAGAAGGSGGAAAGNDYSSDFGEDESTRKRGLSSDDAGVASHHHKESGSSSSAGAGLLRANRPIAVEQFDPEAGLTIETFPSLSAAGNALGISPSSISKILAGKIGYKTAKGFGIRKADEAVAANGNHPNPPTLNP